MTKRILAMLLAIVMVCSLLPVSALAEGKDTEPLATHDSAKHICEHCDATTTWTAWGDDASEKTKLPTSGHYYLVSDIDLQSQTAVGSGELVLCLNGYDVVASKNAHVFRIATTGKVTITDCTAKVVDGIYDAGKITPYSGGGYTVMIVDNTEARFNLYDGIITGAKTNSGSVANMKGSAVFNMYGGEISGNQGGSSGLIYLAGSADFNVYGGTIKNNSATNGGVFYLSTANNAVYIENATITGNTASGSGGVAYSANGVVTVKNSVISGNVAGTGAAFYMKNGTLTLDGAQIINNRTTSSYGAVFATNDGATAYINLKGNTQITGNIFGSETSTVMRDLYLRDHWITPAVTDLATDARIGVYVEPNRIAATNGKQYITNALNGRDLSACFIPNQDAYIATYTTAGSGRVILTEKPAAPEHPHNICGNSACTDHTTDVEFMKWTNATTLPTSGNYFLDTDVTLTAATQLTTGELNLCLNGHTVTVNANGSSVSAFNVKGDAKLNITDCQENPGKITGATNTAIFGNNNSTAIINLYNGILTGNSGNYAGAVFLQAQGVFNMYGGQITGNTHAAKLTLDANGEPALDANGDQTYSGATGGGAICLYYGNATFNMYGGTISENTSTSVTYLKGGVQTKAGGNAGAIYAEGTNTRINLEGGTITKNTADADGGAIYIKKGQATLKAGTISENKAASGGAVYVTDTEAKLTISGTELTGNSANNGGAIMAANRCTVKLESGKISGNTATSSGAGLYISRNTPFTMQGGEISGNTSAGSGAAVYHLESTGTYTGGTITGNTSGYNGGGIFGNGATLELAGVKITGNTAAGAAGVYVNEAATITLSGNTQISGNTAGGKPSNLYLPGNATFQLGQLSADAKIGVSAVNAFRAISRECETDYTANFVSDKTSLQIQYVDKKLYLGAGGDHDHCLCAAALEQGCDHSAIRFAAWEDPNSLPSNGNWYLNTDVTVTSAVDMRDVTLNLCLNGHTITMQTNGKVQIFDMKGAANLSITDCGENPGTITGATKSAVYGNNNATGTINLYNGILTGNSGDMAGAVVLQANMVFNMYGGKISGNTHAAAVDADLKLTGNLGGGAITVYYGNTQFNMYGGEISGNKSTAVSYEKDGTTTNSGGNAGAIYAEGNSAQINLYGGMISGNHADNAGGAVYALKSTVNLLGTKLESNTAGNKAGAVFATGAGQVTLDGSELSGNSAPNGGAILIESQSKFDFISGKVSGNSANDGGGIYMTTNTSFNMQGGEISGNSATGNGGGLALLRCDAVITDGIITENSAKYGGGILVRGTELQLNGGKITKNTASSNGGGIKTGNQETADKSYTAKIIMTGGLVSGNTANAGGGIIVEGAGCSMILRGGEVSGNTAKSDGGGIYVSTKTTFTMEGGKVSDNSAKKGGGVQMLKSTATFKGGEISGNKCTSTGGGVYVTNEPAVATFSGTTVKNNTGGYGGGACAANRATIVLNSGTFSGNTAVNNGGGMYISTNCKLDMYGGAITGNKVEKDTGGGLYGLRSTLNLYGGTVSYNTSTTGGGGIMLGAATLNLKGADVVYNTAISASGGGGTGGGIRTNSQNVKVDGKTVRYSSTINIYSGTVSNNAAGYAGGGILVNGHGAKMFMYGGSINDNTCNDLGGAMYASVKTAVTIEGGELCGNTTKNDGGAIWFGKQTSHSIANAKIAENTAGAKGGALYFHNDAVCSLTDVEFSKNVAKNGGAIFTQPGGNPIMVRCVLTENEATELSGGAVFARFNVTAEDCVFTGNKAGGNGGAIYVGQSSLSVNGWGTQTRDDVGAFITNSTFENNSAAGKGGALCAIMSGFTEIKNTTFTGNTSGETGSAIWTQEDLTMEDVTITGNIATNGGHAVHLDDSTYDGQSYFKGTFKMGGDMIIIDNEGGDLYLGVMTAVGALARGYGENTRIGVTLDSGLLTQRIYGAYNYEGSDLNYLITYGNRSLTDPEVPETVPVETEPGQTEETEPQADTGEDNTVLYLAIGGIAGLIVLAAAVLVIVKKKAGRSTDKVSKN